MKIKRLISILEKYSPEDDVFVAVFSKSSTDTCEIKSVSTNAGAQINITVEGVAALLGSIGGSKTSKTKKATSAENGKLGGRPKKSEINSSK